MKCFTCNASSTKEKEKPDNYVSVFRTLTSRRPLFCLFDIFEGYSVPFDESTLREKSQTVEYLSWKDLLNVEHAFPKQPMAIEESGDFKELFRNLPPKVPLSLKNCYVKFSHTDTVKEIPIVSFSITPRTVKSEKIRDFFEEVRKGEFESKIVPGYGIRFTKALDGFILFRKVEMAKEFLNKGILPRATLLPESEFLNYVHVGTGHIFLIDRCTNLKEVEYNTLNRFLTSNGMIARRSGNKLLLHCGSTRNADLLSLSKLIPRKNDSPSESGAVTSSRMRTKNSVVAERFILGHLGKASRLDLYTKMDNFKADASLNSAFNKINIGEESDEKKSKYVIYARNDDQQLCAYSTEKVIGKGSFGTVYKAVDLRTRDVVAIKKVYQNPRFKNRELPIMKELHHSNVVNLMNFFHTRVDEKPQEEYLNLVMEYVPETVFRVSQNYLSLKRTIPMLEIKLIMYQMCRALAYLHAKGICHRDIKPQNLLLDPYSGVCKLCDFGSAKRLFPTEPNVSYICSRFYRAPELIFGATYYTTAVDIWSSGCVMGELLIGSPLFPGESGIDQLVEIIKKLGTPAKEEMNAMNKDLQGLRFPRVNPRSWRKIFRKRTPPEAIDFVSKLLRYDPAKRITAIESLAHPFFDELRDPNTQYMKGSLPPLFDFTEEECEAMSQEERMIVFPPHAAHLFETRPYLEKYFGHSVSSTPSTPSPVPMMIN